MGAPNTSARVALGMLLMMMGQGCSLAVGDVDRFDKGCDLDLELTRFGLHAPDNFEIRVVSVERDQPRVVARAVMKPFEFENARVNMRGAVPSGTHHLDFFADRGAVGYDEVDDHRWRVEDICASTPIEFPHNGSFNQLPANPSGRGGNLVVRVMEFPASGQSFEMRVVDAEQGRTVGVFRRAAVRTARFPVRLRGVLVPGRRYKLLLWSDDNDNDRYEPDVDSAWTVADVMAEENTEVTFKTPPETADIGRIAITPLDSGGM